jgi:uncharacterized repeat protein (TIGR01451 family)
MMTRTPASDPSRAQRRAHFVPTALSSARRGWPVWFAVAMLLAAAPAQAQTGNSSAFGVQANGSVTGGNIIFGTLVLGPVPTASGSAPPAYNVTNTAASASGNLSVTSPSAQTVSSVATAFMQVNAQSPVPADPTASATVNNLAFGLNIVPTTVPQSALGISATQVQSSADIGGTCGGPLTPVGSTTITNGTLSGQIQTLLGLSGTIVSNPAPNTVLLDVTAVAGVLTSGRIRVVLNEQIVSGNGTTNLSLTVNAIHITVSGAVLLGVPGTVNLDVVIAQSRAALNCPGPLPQADISIVMTDSPDPVNAPGTITYQITVTNGGPANVPQAVVTDDLPLGPNVTLVSATPSQGTCGTSDPLVCDLGVLNAGATATITVTVNVQPGAPSPLVNIATVTDASGVTTDPNPANNTATTSTTVSGGGGGSADLSIVKTGTPNPVTVGQSLTYVLTIKNNGPSAATNVVVSDPVPPGATLQSATPSAGGNCTTGAVVTCTFPSVAAGATVSVAIIVTAPPQPGILTNTAVVSSSVADPNPANNSSTTNTTVTGGSPGTADLSITKVANPNPVLPGQTVTYLITVTNNGPSAATNVVVSDPVPLGATLQTATPSAGGSCTTGAVVTCTFPSLAASASATVTIAVTAPLQAGSLTNTVVVSSNVPDPNPANNTATTVTQVGVGPASADLAVTKTASPNSVTPSGTLTYLITVTNNGPNAATSVVVTDTLPAGVVLVSATPSAGGSCGTGNPVVCTFPVLAADTGATVTIVVTAPSSGGPLVNTVTVTSPVSDPNPSNNTATTTTPISSAGIGLSANLGIIKSASPNPVGTGAQLTYLLTVTNFGPNTATNVVVTDQLPSQVSPVSAVASGGGVCTLGPTVTCTFSSLANQASVTVTIVVTAPGQPGALINTAAVSSAVNDPDPSNNTVFLVTQVVSAAAVAAPIPTLSEWAMIVLVSLIMGFGLRELQRRRRSGGGPAAA